MKQREMGPYVLLHKLAEDALSQTYRAGMKSGDDVERVVLFCLFQATGDIGWIADTASVGHRALQGLESPHLADLVDSGEIDGRAFLAYDYVPGITLSGLMKESRKHRIPVPLGLALLIANRSAEAMVAAWQHESRMLHGFLVPALVLVSNEGEVQVLGFEVASRLRRLLSDERVKAELGAYLAPEVVPEGQPATTDDVYSLGAMLFELLTGNAPPSGEQELQAAIESATVAEGEEIPDEVRDLLTTSLAAPPRRSSLRDWAEALREIILSGRYEASSFDLAFFLNRLLGHDFDERTDEPSGPALDYAAAEEALENEEALSTVAMRAQEISSDEAGDREVALSDALPSVEPDVLASGAWAAAAADHPGDDDTVAEEGRMAEAVTRADDSDDAARSQRKLLAIAASVVAVLLASLGVTYFMDKDDATPVAGSVGYNARSLDGSLSQPSGQRPALPGQSDPSVPAATTGAGAAATTSPKAAAQPAAEEVSQADIDRRVQDLVSKRSSTIEASLREEYAQQIAALQAQLEARNASAQEEPTLAETDPAETDPAETDPSAQLSVLPRTLAASQTAAQDPAEPGTSNDATAAPQQAATPTAGGSGAATTASVDQSAGEDLPQQTYAAPATETEIEGVDDHAPASPAEASRKAEPDPSSEVAEPASEAPQVGDLVEPGAGVTPPTLETSVQPSYPPMAKRLNKRAVVTVRVLVDETGKVTDVEQVGDPAGYGFDEAAEKAARAMIWKPATKNGVKVKMWWTLRLAFQP